MLELSKAASANGPAGLMCAPTIRRVTNGGYISRTARMAKSGPPNVGGIQEWARWFFVAGHGERQIMLNRYVSSRIASSPPHYEESWSTTADDVGAVARIVDFDAGQRQHRQCAPDSEVNSERVQTGSTGMSLPKDALRWPSRLPAIATTCRKRRISRRSTCSYRSDREESCHDTLPWLVLLVDPSHEASSRHRPYCCLQFLSRPLDSRSHLADQAKRRRQCRALTTPFKKREICSDLPEARYIYGSR